MLKYLQRCIYKYGFYVTKDIHKISKNYTSPTKVSDRNSFRANHNLIENSVWINPSSDFFGLIWIENLVSDSIGLMSRIKSDKVGLIFDCFLSDEIQNVSRIGSEWFSLARIQISEWIGILLIVLEWISIRLFRQGSLIKIVFIFNAELCTTIPKIRLALFHFV